ncbi:hypothetical protein ACVIWU_005864 [Bradyrhizobium sp. USDA 4509]|nr:hypothetical protein [Bradyrhizobium elkanii]
MHALCLCGWSRELLIGTATHNFCWLRRDRKPDVRVELPIRGEFLRMLAALRQPSVIAFR